MNIKKSVLPYGRQYIDEEDIRSVEKVLKSDYLTTGPMVEQFESKIKSYVNVKNAVVCSSGTSALFIASMAIGLSKDDAVIIPSITFVATANAPDFLGAEIVIADVDPLTGLMTFENIKEAIKRAKNKVKAIFPVYYAGQCNEVVQIFNYARKNNIFIIEDACHALGTEYFSTEWQKIGSCKNSDICVFSFHPVKSIAAGEAGVAVTNNKTLAEKLKVYRNHGIYKTHSDFKNLSLAYEDSDIPNPWYYEMERPSLNFRASDIHCALGVSQLKKIDRFVDKRRRLADLYKSLFKKYEPEIRIIKNTIGCNSCWHIFVVLIDFKKLKITRSVVIKNLFDNGISSQVHYIPIHMQPYYNKRNKSLKLIGAERFYRKTLTLPLFFGMEEEDVIRVFESLLRALGMGI